MKPILDRRTFLKNAGALTVSAALAASGASAAAFEAASRGPRISAVLFDSRYSSCREFAEALAREGAAAFDARADIAALWYGPLRDHLVKYGGCVAGLTTYSDSMVSESFGRDLRVCLRYEGSHDCRGTSVIAHRLRGLVNVDGVGAVLRYADSNWSQSLACAMARTRWTEFATQWKSSIAHTSRLEDHPGFLRSWLLSA